MFWDCHPVLSLMACETCPLDFHQMVGLSCLIDTEVILKPWDGVCCWYRFSWKPISTYMSLTLARLCGEWQLVSKNYKAWSGKYKAWIVIFRNLAADYFNCGILQFWLKYKARIAIFCILAAIDRFSWISWKVESRWGKSESRWRNQKAVEEY